MWYWRLTLWSDRRGRDLHSHSRWVFSCSSTSALRACGTRSGLDNNKSGCNSRSNSRVVFNFRRTRQSGGGGRCRRLLAADWHTDERRLPLNATNAPARVPLAPPLRPLTCIPTTPRFWRHAALVKCVGKGAVPTRACATARPPSFCPRDRREACQPAREPEMYAEMMLLLLLLLPFLAAVLVWGHPLRCSHERGRDQCLSRARSLFFPCRLPMSGLIVDHLAALNIILDPLASKMANYCRVTKV